MFQDSKCNYEKENKNKTIPIILKQQMKNEGLHFSVYEVDTQGKAVKKHRRCNRKTIQFVTFQF